MVQLRVLHVIQSVDPHQGGPVTALSSMTTGLSAAGVGSEIATTTGRADTDPAGLPGQIHTFNRTFDFYWTAPSFGRWMKAHCRSFDLVHIHGVLSWLPTIAAHRAHHEGVPYVVSTLGHLDAWSLRNGHRWLKRASVTTIEKRMLEAAAAVHVASEAEAREVARIAHARVEVIPLGVDMPAPAAPGEFRRRHPATGDGPIVLFLSRIHPKKGLDLLLDAFSRVAAGTGPRPALVIAGDGDRAYVRALQQQAVALGIDDRVVWTGFLEPEARRAALADAALFVLASHAENFGISVVEAMAAGVPVVISDQVGIHDEVARAGAGVVVACDVTALEKAMTDLLADDERRTTMGIAARGLAGQRFSTQAMISSLLALYERATSFSPR